MVRFTVYYPLAPGDRLVLRAEPDWQADILPLSQGQDRATFEIAVFRARQVKPVLLREGSAHWSVGSNYVLRDSIPTQSGYPCFLQQSGRLTSRMPIDAPTLGAPLTVRMYLPAGYDENSLKRYPVLYAADGANLFDGNESSSGEEWGVDETVALLDRMSVIRKIIVVGLYAREGLRNDDYTKPGYEAFGRALTAEIIPRIDATFRTVDAPSGRAILGSSLGGVLATYLLWQYPDTFGAAAAMSATFGYRDDLLERLSTEPLRPVRLYLDSGWPLDNFEPVRKMAHTLWSRSMPDVHYTAHPRGLHSELHWADRLHMPLQFLFGER